jgi:cytochrome b involved in lipid metabolism
MSKEFKVSEVAAHKIPEDGMYIIVDSNVYDVTGTPSTPAAHRLFSD